MSPRAHETPPECRQVEGNHRCLRSAGGTARRKPGVKRSGTPGLGDLEGPALEGRQRRSIRYTSFARFWRRLRGAGRGRNGIRGFRGCGTPPSFRPSGTLRNLRTTDNGQRTTDNGQRTTDNGQRTTDKRKSKNPLTPGRIPAYISILMRKSVTEQSPHIQETTTPPLHLSNLRQGYHRQANLQLIVLRDTP